MCVCEALSTAMTAELPAVWNPTAESAASVGLSDRVTSVEENDLQKGSGETTAAETLINVSLTEISVVDKDIGLSKTIIKADEGICRLLKVDSKSGETLRINSSSEESMPIKTETQNGTKLPKFVKKSSSPLLNINSGNSSSDEEEYFKPLKKLRMIPLSQKGGASPIKVDQDSHQPQPLSVSSSSRVKSFSITDILRHSTSAAVGTGTSPHPKDKQFVNSSRIVRPWDTDEEQTEDYEDEMSISSPSSSTGGSPRPASSGPRLGESHSKHHEGNPLDALFQMTSKTFEGLKKGTNADGSGDRLLFSAKQSSKKKRKSRTAFSNHQIFELEKRFLYQKYLSPADRDELALTLGLTNAQVITWFQNRRAKLKRDLEEIKKDVHTTALLTDHSAFIKTMTQMGLKPVDLFNCRK